MSIINVALTTTKFTANSDIEPLKGFNCPICVANLGLGMFGFGREMESQESNYAIICKEMAKIVCVDPVKKYVFIGMDPKDPETALIEYTEEADNNIYAQDFFEEWVKTHTLFFEFSVLGMSNFKKSSDIRFVLRGLWACEQWQSLEIDSNANIQILKKNSIQKGIIMINIVNSKEYQESRKEMEPYFIKPESSKEIPSNSGNYVLTIQYYKTKKGCWQYTRGIVRSNSGDFIADIKRNYSSFPHLFIEHPNGKEYLLCGEDYQGYTIINLTDKTTKTFIPEGWLKGWGFCFAGYEFYKDNQQLIVEGCYWGAPFEIVTYDFSNPDILPLPELSRKDVPIEKDEDDED